MESFKFVVDTNKNYGIRFKKYLKIDIITAIQYYCLRKLLSDNNVDTYDTYYINNTTVVLENKCKLDSSPTFYASCNKYVDLYIHDNYHDNYCISWNMLIDEFKEILLTGKFDDIINNHVINEYNALYTYTKHRFRYNRNIGNELVINNHMFVFDNINILYAHFFQRHSEHIDNMFPLEPEDHRYYDRSFTPIVYHDTCILNLVNEYTNHVIDNEGFIDNTMSEHIVYTSDLEVTKQVIRNNQKIIANIVKKLNKESLDEISDSNKQKLMRFLTGEETKPEIKSEVKPKQRTKITL